MKKITFTFCIAIIALLLPQNSKAQTEYRLDRRETFSREDPNWIEQFREFFTYDEANVYFTNLLIEQYDSGNWVEIFQKIRTYNADNTLNTDISQFKNGGSWVNQFKSEYMYDTSGNNNIITHYNPNGMGGWIEYQQDRLMYNASGYNTETIRYIRNFVVWTESLKYVYTYPVDLLTKQEDFKWDPTSMPLDWATSTHHTIDYTYYPSTLIKDATEQTDLLLGSGLEYTNRIEYMYIADKLDTETNKIRESGVWVDESEIKYSYDVNDLIKEIIISSEAPPSARTSLALTPQTKIVYYWIDANLGIGSEELMSGKAYPNPFHIELTISLKSALETKGTLQIFDLQGKELSKIGLNQGVKTIKLNNPYLSKGVYFIKVTSASQNHTFKVIKQ